MLTFKIRAYPSKKQQDPSLKEINAQVLQQVPLRLDNAYQTFFKQFKNCQGFPKFRSCMKFFGIRYVQNGYSVNEHNLYTKNYGSIKLIKHRHIKGNIKQVYITTQNGKWFVCITTDYTSNIETKNKEFFCLDVGITNLVVTSDGVIIKNKNHAKYFDSQIKKLQSRRSKCKKGSRKYKHYRYIIQRLYSVKSGKINDFQHKVSKTLSQTYNTIIVENLAVKKMSE